MTVTGGSWSKETYQIAAPKMQSVPGDGAARVVVGFSMAQPRRSATTLQKPDV
jgi:hypothetical protein